MSTDPWLWYSSSMVEEDPMTYAPHIPHNIPYLLVPENRVKCVFDWYKRGQDHPMNFPAYAYWIQKCETDGSDY